jgi:hypothetical protein
MENASNIAEAGYTRTIENVSIDSSNLRRHIGADAHRLSSYLVDDFKSSEIQISARSCQKRVNVLHQRRTDDFKTVACHQF